MIKIYVIDVFNTKYPAPAKISDENFIKEANERGECYTLKEFEKVFNEADINDELSTDNSIIRIIENE